MRRAIALLLALSSTTLAACDNEPLYPGDPDARPGSSDPCSTLKADVDAVAAGVSASLTTARQDAANVVTASDGEAEQAAEGHTDIVCVAHGTVDEDALAGTPSCGSLSGDGSEVICHSGARGEPVGEQLVLAMTVDQPLEPVEPSRYQYSMVMQTDDDPANDYVPDPAFPADWWTGADRVFELPHRPNRAWSLWVADYNADGYRIEDDDSQARAFVQGRTLMLVVPLSELGEDVGLQVPTRFTAFEHDGSYLEGPWSGDVAPEVPDWLPVGI